MDGSSQPRASGNVVGTYCRGSLLEKGSQDPVLVAHDCGYPLSRYTCRATRVAADFLDFIAFCRCSTGVVLHPLKILVSHLPPPCVGRCRTEIRVCKGVALHGGVAATVAGVALHCATKDPVATRFPT